MARPPAIPGTVERYAEDNRANWDERAPAHAASPDYAIERFVEDPSFLSGVVRFDLPRLGDIAGLKGVHLQCHIGTDTISLARLGARMTGLDLSPASLEQARRLARRTGADVDVRRVRGLRRRVGARRRRVRPRVHGHRSDLLAAVHPALGAGGGRPAAARREAVHARGPPDAVDARRSPARPVAGRRISVLRARGADGLGRPRHLRRRPTRSSSTTSRTSGTTASARSSRR